MTIECSHCHGFGYFARQSNREDDSPTGIASDCRACGGTGQVPACERCGTGPDEGGGLCGDCRADVEEASAPATIEQLMETEPGLAVVAVAYATDRVLRGAGGFEEWVRSHAHLMPRRVWTGVEGERPTQAVHEERA